MFRNLILELRLPIIKKGEYLASIGEIVMGFRYLLMIDNALKQDVRAEMCSDILESNRLPPADLDISRAIKIRYNP